MTDINDNVSLPNKEIELERTPSNTQKIHYTHDQKKFIKVFPELIQEASSLGTVCSCNLERDVLWQGKIYPTAYHICFYGKIFAKAAKVTIHFKDITQIEKRSTVGMFPNAIRISTANIEYVFSSFLKRDVTYQAFCDTWHRVIKSNNEVQVNEQFININPVNQISHVDTNEPINRHVRASSLDQIDTAAFAQDELKRSSNEEDIHLLSQSFQEHSPFENDINSNQNETELTGAMDLMNSQASNGILQNKMLDNIYNIDSKGLYQILFEDNSKFLYDVYKSAYNENIKINLWKKDPRTNLKERIIMYNSLNKALFTARGNVLTEEKQKFLKNDKDNFFIESEIRLLNINYSDYFKIICKYFIISEKDDYSRLLVTFEIKFNKKFALSDKIEKTMVDNYTRLFMELENHLSRSIKKIANDGIKDINTAEEVNEIAEALSSGYNGKLVAEMDSSYETLNEKKLKVDFTPSSYDEKLDLESENTHTMNTLFNVKIFRSQFFNYILDGVFLILSILIHFPTILINITHFTLSLFKPQDQKHSKRKNKDEKKILSSAPYLIIVLGIFLLVGTIITITNAYYVHQLQDLEKIIKSKNINKFDSSILSKLNEDILKDSDALSGSQKIIQSLMGSSYERYNNILELYTKQKEKHLEDFNMSNIRLNNQLELMNKKFNAIKFDIEKLMKDFSSEELAKLINELEQNTEKDN